MNKNLKIHKCQNMEHHLLDPIEPDSESRNINMRPTNDNCVRRNTSETMDHNNNHQNHRNHSRSNCVTFQISFLRPKRKTRSFIRKLLGGSIFAKLHSSSLVSLFVILSFIQLLGYSKNANAMISKESKYGLTAYAEPCTDECKQRGFPYTWCHKKPSRNGTWIDRDYCSPGPGLTRYLEPCLESCHQDKRERSGSFYWCKTAPTSRGNWDYCSPYPRDACAWSSWSGWTACNASCGPRSATRTRRRRIESVRDGPGKVGHCSGQIEQSISICSELPECQGALLPEDCEWSDWGPWTQCSITCSRTPKSLSSDSRLSGEVLQDVGTQQRIRTIKKQAKYGGTPCDELRDGVQLIRCRAETPCSPKPITITTEQPFFEYEDRDVTTERFTNEGSGLEIDLQFEQETTVKTPLVSSIFTEPSSSPAFDIDSDDFSTPPESPRTFDTSKFFNKQNNFPSNSFSNPKKGLSFRPKSKNNFFSVNEDKKEVLDDIFNILEDKPISTTTTTTTPPPKAVVSEKRLPFTVVRVSSSVSQIRPNNNENDIQNSGEVSNIDKDSVEVSNEKTITPTRPLFFPKDSEEVSTEKKIAPTRPLFFPTRPIPKTTPKDNDDNFVPEKKTQEKKKTSTNTGRRQPFLKPKVSFQDISIPSLDKKKNNNIKRPKPFDFNRGGAGKRPLSAVLGFRTTTDATTTSSSTTTEPVESESSTPVPTTRASTARTFANIFNRFSFATERTTTAEPIESIKSLLDLIPKDDVELKETTSSRSLLDLIPISNLDDNSFDFEDEKFENEIDDEKESSTLRASLDIIPIKSTTDHNTINEIEITEKPTEDDSEDKAVEVPEKTRDLQIIPIPPRPSRPTTTEENEATTETTTTTATSTSTTVSTTDSEETTRRISRLQQIVQSRRTTTFAPATKSKKPFSRKNLFERNRAANRPTISIRFRNRPNVTQVSEVTPIEKETTRKQEEETEQPTTTVPSSLSNDEEETTTAAAQDEDVTTTELTTPFEKDDEIRPTFGGRQRSRFRPKSKLSDLFPKRRPSSNNKNVPEIRRRPFFRPRNRLTTTRKPLKNIETDDEIKETTAIGTTPNGTPTAPASRPSATPTRRRPTFRRLPTRPPVPQNTKSPLLKSILDRARQRGQRRRTTRAPIRVINKETTFQPRITGGASLGRSPSVEPTQSDFVTDSSTEDARLNDIDDQELVKIDSSDEELVENDSSDEVKSGPTAITMDYVPDYDDEIEDDYGSNGLDDFVINEDGELENDIEEKVRSNAGGPSRSQKTQSVGNRINGLDRSKSRDRKPQKSLFNNQQRRPAFTSPRPPLNPTTTFWIVNSTPTPVSTTRSPTPVSTTAATTTTANRFSINEIDDLSSPGASGYDPCTELNACGPNAICIARGQDPVCSCPLGFSGIPRNGIPDPSHGCVRTPQKCGIDEFLPNHVQDDEDIVDTCPIGQKCVRNFCLPNCNQDDQCSLGERCVENSCIKICFYDAHCLAGEFCEKSDQLDGAGSGGGNNGVCIAGCRRDTNCPFGQVCVDVGSPGGTRVEKRCMDGCHFNNDCSQQTACLNQTCQDPCRPNGDNFFDECGVNAECQVISHAPTCKCPEGFRPLNSPYVACVPLDMDLEEITCLKDSDCDNSDSNNPQTCRDFKCQSQVPG